MGAVEHNAVAAQCAIAMNVEGLLLDGCIVFGVLPSVE